MTKAVPCTRHSWHKHMHTHSHEMACIVSIEIGWPYHGRPMAEIMVLGMGSKRMRLKRSCNVAFSDDRLIIEVVKKGRSRAQHIRGEGALHPYVQFNGGPGLPSRTPNALSSHHSMQCGQNTSF